MTVPDPTERLLALATACAEEFGLPEVAAHLRNPRLSSAIAWASDEWRSVAKEPPPVGEWVSVTGGFDWIDPPPAMVARRVRGRDVEPFWEDSLRTIIVAPTWWRPLRLPPPPSEPKPGERRCERCKGERTICVEDSYHGGAIRIDCDVCRGTGRVSPAPPSEPAPAPARDWDRCNACEGSGLVPGHEYETEDCGECGGEGRHYYDGSGVAQLGRTDG